MKHEKGYTGVKNGANGTSVSVRNHIWYSVAFLGGCVCVVMTKRDVEWWNGDTRGCEGDTVGMWERLGVC